MSQAQAESQRLAAQLENMQASQTARGIVLTLDDVLVRHRHGGAQVGCCTLDRSDRRVPRRILSDACRSKDLPTAKAADDYNLELSQSRADAVAMAIIQRGMDAQRVRALGYGEDFPVASNDSAGSRQLNRPRGDHRLQR